MKNETLIILAFLMFIHLIFVAGLIGYGVANHSFKNSCEVFSKVQVGKDVYNCSKI